MTSFIDDNGNELEYDGKDFAITRQIVSFFNFQIKGDASVNVKIPNTSRNRELLGWFDINQISPSIKTKINLYRDGNKADTGSLIKTRVNNDFIECFFLTGNSGWIKLWDFFCDEITTSKYDVLYEYNGIGYSIENTFANTDGIIFPVVDWSMRGDLYENIVFERAHVGNDSADGAQFGDEIRSWVPCLYIHTLLKLLANHAGTSISGDIFNDPFFKTIIMTPKNMDRWNTFADKFNNRIVKPEHIAPNIKAVQLIKWVSVSFGCLVSFDNYSNTISINQIDKIEKSNAKDWSDYFLSHESELSKYFQFNSIINTDSTEANIVDYNNLNPIHYGDLRIESEKDDGSNNEIYKSPFLPLYDVTGDSQLRWATPIGDIWRLKDDEKFEFSTVTSIGGKAQFNGSDFPWSVSTSTFGLLIRVEDGDYKGFHYRDAGGTDTNSEFLSSSTFKGTDSGSFWTQTAEKISGHKVLSCIPNVSVNSFLQFTTLKPGPLSPISTVATAYFSKKTTMYSILNSYKQGLNYGEINEENRNDISLQEKYLKRYSNILKSPPIRAKFKLPEKEFVEFNFGYVFLRTEKLTGYFLVESIKNFVESTTPVDIYLVKD